MQTAVVGRSRRRQPRRRAVAQRMAWSDGKCNELQIKHGDAGCAQTKQNRRSSSVLFGTLLSITMIQAAPFLLVCTHSLLEWPRHPRLKRNGPQTERDDKIFVPGFSYSTLVSGNQRTMTLGWEHSHRGYP